MEFAYILLEFGFEVTHYSFRTGFNHKLYSTFNFIFLTYMSF